MSSLMYLASSVRAAPRSSQASVSSPAVDHWLAPQFPMPGSSWPPFRGHWAVLQPTRVELLLHHLPTTMGLFSDSADRVSWSDLSPQLQWMLMLLTASTALTLLLATCLIIRSLASGDCRPLAKTARMVADMLDREEGDSTQGAEDQHARRRPESDRKSPPVAKTTPQSSQSPLAWPPPGCARTDSAIHPSSTPPFMATGQVAQRASPAQQAQRASRGAYRSVTQDARAPSRSSPPVPLGLHSLNAFSSPPSGGSSRGAAAPHGPGSGGVRTLDSLKQPSAERLLANLQHNYATATPSCDHRLPTATNCRRSPSASACSSIPSTRPTTGVGARLREHPLRGWPREPPYSAHSHALPMHPPPPPQPSQPQTEENLSPPLPSRSIPLPSPHVAAEGTCRGVVPLSMWHQRPLDTLPAAEPPPPRPPPSPSNGDSPGVLVTANPAPTAAAHAPPTTAGMGALNMLNSLQRQTEAAGRPDAAVNLLAGLRAAATAAALSRAQPPPSSARRPAPAHMF